MSYIVVVLLEHNKYWIEKCNFIPDSLQFLQMKDSEWIKKYVPLSITEIWNVVDPFDEDKLIISKMKEYGVGNVRGGIYYQLILSFEQKMEIWQRMNQASDRCIACGLNDHLINTCDTRICYRCGRVAAPPHTETTCRYLSNQFGGSSFGCYRCGRPDHWAIRCTQEYDCFGRKLETTGCIIS